MCSASKRGSRDRSVFLTRSPQSQQRRMPRRRRNLFEPRSRRSPLIKDLHVDPVGIFHMQARIGIVQRNGATLL